MEEICSRLTEVEQTLQELQKATSNMCGVLKNVLSERQALAQELIQERQKQKQQKRA
jgi:hypothetical protein